MTPTPPLLFVRPGLAFWVEPVWNTTSSVTLQALREGCYHGAWCLDSRGVRWPILEAALVNAPTILERLLPWRRVPVRLRLGQPVSEPLTVAVDEIRQVLHSPDFSYEGEVAIEDWEAELLAVQSPRALIELARRAVKLAV